MSNGLNNEDFTDSDLINTIFNLNSLPEYRRKQIAILLLSTTLTKDCSVELSSFMDGLANTITRSYE